MPPGTPDDGRCLASITPKRVAGWTEHGRIVVALDDGQPTSMEAIDTAGASIAKRTAPKTKAEARAALKDLTCRLGGVVATLDGTAPESRGAATATFVVLVPAVVDENADVLALCSEPEVQAGDAQERRLTFDQLEQRLTSRRWRAWLFDLADEHERTTGSERMTVHWRRADELAEAVRRAGLRGRCWFETQLRSPDG